MNNCNTGISDIQLSNQRSTDNLLKNTVSKEISIELSNALQALIKLNGFVPENLIYIVTNLMSIAGRYKTLNGIEKKEIVIILVNRSIADSDLDVRVKNTLKLMMETVVPGSIDIMVDISKGRYKFKYVPKIYTWLKKYNCCC